ncbi:hypothetical protein GCM10009104_16940 [Marinobacterium maritimum]|uniref:Uncharacterized protein n=1 Tax=Marinobacterium maritimum TaxID=500162 RepID=A0ABP3TBP8_9GAMM
MLLKPAWWADGVPVGRLHERPEVLQSYPSYNISDRTTIWHFEKSIGEVGTQAQFDGVSA